MDANGELALVTGASRGIGRAAALALAKRGLHVVALARTLGGLEELDDEIKAVSGKVTTGFPSETAPPQTAGGRCVLIPLDVTDDDGVARMAEALFARWGRLDVWVHAAAKAEQMTAANHISAKDWDAVFAVNARAVQRLSQALDPLLQAAPRPRVLYLADDKADKPFWGAYGASKRAGESIMRAYGAEQAGRIDVRIETPDPAPTALRARFWPGEDQNSLAPTHVTAEALIAPLFA